MRELPNKNHDSIENSGLSRSNEQFPHRLVENKWIQKWTQADIYHTSDSSKKPPFYILDMFPYPSGDGLHVGHIEGYTGTDVVARYKRMKGFEVLHPMGWDAFGLPTENFAIKTGRDPQEVTETNTTRFREQCDRMGFSFDWKRELTTSDELYYQWTQRIFLDLYKTGLAYKTKSPANWCTGCETTIANEQVKTNCCERCQSPVETRNVDQWFFRTTAYADRLIEGLSGLDWPASTIRGQQEWIGKTEGTEIQFRVENEDEVLPIFTREPERLYETSFIAVAPEHPIVTSLTTAVTKESITRYIRSFTPQSVRGRKEGKMDIDGIFTGKFVINPLTEKRIPIWVTNYAVMDDRSGIIMGVPTHDERDKKFAQKYGIDIPSITIIDDKKNEIILFGPEKYRGRQIQNIRDEVLIEIEDISTPTANYNLRDWTISRERFWGAPIPIVYCEEHGEQAVPMEQLPVLLPEDLQEYTPSGVPPLSKSSTFLHTDCPYEGCKRGATRETKTFDTFVDSSWYFLRFTDPENTQMLANPQLLQRWLPVDYYLGGAEHTNGHLLYARFMTKALHDLGILSFDEPFQTLRHPGIIKGEDGLKMSKSRGNVINPDDVSEEFGSDTLRLYELFMGPLKEDKPWATKAIKGPKRFIDRVWRLQYTILNDTSEQEEKSTAQLVQKVTQRIEDNEGRYNLVISDLIAYVKEREKAGGITKNGLEIFLKVLAPFAPFITEELWERLDKSESIHLQPWPTAEITITQKNTQIPVTINGKKTGMIDLDPTITADDDALRAYLITKGFLVASNSRIVFIPNKIVNIVL